MIIIISVLQASEGISVFNPSKFFRAYNFRLHPNSLSISTSFRKVWKLFRDYKNDIENLEYRYERCIALNA